MRRRSRAPQLRKLVQISMPSWRRTMARRAVRSRRSATKIARSKPVFALGKINNGQIDVPSILLDVVVVTKENMMDTIVKDGFHKAAEVSRSLPEAQQSR